MAGVSGKFERPLVTKIFTTGRKFPGWSRMTSSRGASPLREITLEDIVRIMGPVMMLYNGPPPCPTCATDQAGHD